MKRAHGGAEAPPESVVIMDGRDKPGHNEQEKWVAPLMHRNPGGARPCPKLAHPADAGL
jgi:hypothetical protein